MDTRELPATGNPFRHVSRLCEQLIDEEQARFAPPVWRTEVLSGVEMTRLEFPSEDAATEMARWRDREDLIDELNARLEECQVVGYEIWQPRTDAVRRRLRAVVEAFDKLQYWRDDCRQRKAPTEQANPIPDEIVDGLRTACSQIEPLARKWDQRNPHGVDEGNDQFRRG